MSEKPRLLGKCKMHQSCSEHYMEVCNRCVHAADDVVRQDTLRLVRERIEAEVQYSDTHDHDEEHDPLEHHPKCVDRILALFAPGGEFGEEKTRQDERGAG